MRYPWQVMDSVKFERLAFDYVCDKYPEQDWTMLPLSGDGNRDVESRSRHYFFGQAAEYASWVEAKYTQSLTRSLSKGRLDPTIVSALIEPNVGAVMFISNGCFNTAYINRAERALRVRHVPVPPRFIDGKLLENWLDRVPRIAKRYFRARLPKRITTADPFAFAIHEAQIVAMDDYRAGHLEGRRALVSQEDYVLQLLIATASSRTFRFRISGPGLTLLTSPEFPDSVFLHEGLTSLALRFTADLQVTNGKLVAAICDQESDRIESKSIAYSICPAPVQIRSAGQLSALQRLADRLRNHQRIPYAHLLRLTGDAATGKTWILSRIVAQVSLNVPVRRYTFMQDRPTYNAQTICRALLFMTVGTAFEFEGFANAIGRHIRSEDISRDLFDWLVLGVSNSQKALELLSLLTRSDLLGPLFTQNARGDAKILILDDLHKADNQTVALLKRLFTEFADSENKTLIVLGTRPDVRAEIDEAVICSEVETIEIDPVTTRDVSETLIDIVGVDRAEKIARDLGPAITNLLELFQFTDSLRQQIAGLSALPDPAFMRRCRELLRDATAIGMVGSVRSREEKRILDFLFIMDGGIETEFVRITFGLGLVERLLANGLVISLSADPPLLAPKHDLVRDAYLAHQRVYSDQLGDVLDLYMSWAPMRRNDLLGHLCRCGPRWRSRYLSAAIEARDVLIDRTQYGAARSIAEALYVLGEQGHRAGMSEIQRLESIYAHADCITHTRSAGRSIEFFQQACTVADQCAPSMESYALKFQATAALVSARFWSLDTKNLLKDIDIVLAEWEALPPEYTRHPRLVDGYLTALNRRMMVYFLHDRLREAEAAYRTGVAASRRLNDQAHLGHLFMDKGKSLCLRDPSRALHLFQQAHSIYSSLPNEQRRLMVCASQMAFVNVILGHGHKSELESKADKLVRSGYATEYVNALLELAAISLVATDVERARHLLTRVERSDAALDSPRKLMMYYHLMAVLLVLERNVEEARRFMDSHLQAANSLGRSYSVIAKHNAGLPDGDRVCWGHCRLQSSIWIDNRLW